MPVGVQIPMDEVALCGVWCWLSFVDQLAVARGSQPAVDASACRRTARMQCSTVRLGAIARLASCGWSPVMLIEGWVNRDLTQERHLEEVK